MSREKLIQRVSAEGGFDSKAAAERAIDAVFAGIRAGVRDGERVVLKGFGTFTKKHGAERKGRNPHTGETITIAARDRVAFKPHFEL